MTKQTQVLLSSPILSFRCTPLKFFSRDLKHLAEILPPECHYMNAFLSFHITSPGINPSLGVLGQEQNAIIWWEISRHRMLKSALAARIFQEGTFPPAFLLRKGKEQRRLTISAITRHSEPQLVVHTAVKGFLPKHRTVSWTTDVNTGWRIKPLLWGLLESAPSSADTTRAGPQGAGAQALCVAAGTSLAHSSRRTDWDASLTH